MGPDGGLTPGQTGGLTISRKITLTLTLDRSSFCEDSILKRYREIQYRVSLLEKAGVA
jgi:hypothetical protein